MKIVVLDGYTVNPGDLSWRELEGLGECVIYERSRPEEVFERAQGAEVVVSNKVRLSREMISRFPELRLISVLATGYDVIDTKAAREQGVTVANVPAYGTDSVAQLTVAHILNLTQHVAQHAELVRQGAWSRCPDFCFWTTPLVELSGLTLGLVGLGAIGSKVATIAQALGMRILASVSKPRPNPPGIELVDRETLFRESDIVSLHCPLVPATAKLVCAETLSLMKPTAFLINTSRGGLVDEQALAGALSRGEIAGAGLDVLAEEPPKSGSPLLEAPNCCVTPHIAWATRASRARLLTCTVENIRAFAAGKPIHVVN